MRLGLILTTEMPSESPAVPAQTEKPQHYLYLKEFRTQQCPLFLQHKCTQHRPFTCFHWHFMNQRRRRPIRKRDGTFNYSPDVYCAKYDETNGLCPDGDECPYLHRTAGDTERRYHLRYYKTGTCVYETDSKGNCMKNGPHCAFAHGAHDLRPALYDIRELQAIETPEVKSSAGSTPSTPSSLEKDKILAEDPKWNDTNYVLANYKTEPCKRPPRLCRQGYACPSYHNARDRRRSPKKVKYRSTPCPNVKHGDDWGDPTQCENGDNCAYCHTRTEQQFHPEIYKSTKCNDMVQTGHCPRGPFCAFAHVEQEITTQREVLSTSENSLAAFVSTVLPQQPESEIPTTASEIFNCTSQNQKVEQNGSALPQKLPDPIGKERTNSIPHLIGNNIQGSINRQNSSPLPEPIGKGRSSSTSSSITSDSGFYQRAPGSEREDSQMVSMKLRQQLASIDSDPSIDPVEKAKRKQNLLMLHSLTIGTNTNSPMGLQQSSLSSMSPLAPVFYPARDTVGSVVGHALDELNLDDIDINSIDKELDKDNDTNSLSSSLSAGIPSSGFGSCSQSLPIGIPPGGLQRGSVGSLSQSPPSPYGSFSHTLLTFNQKTEPGDQVQNMSLLSHPNHTKFSNTHSDVNSMSPRSGPGGPHSPLYSSSNLSNSSHSADFQRLRDEIVHSKARLEHWEQAYTQAKCACEAWKKEAEESIRKVKSAEEDKLQAIKERDEAQGRAGKLKTDMETLVGSGSMVRYLQRSNDIESLPLPQLRHLQQQLRLDIEKVDKLIVYHQSMKCIVCLDRIRGVTSIPCNHKVMCDLCASKSLECPLCHSQLHRSNMGYRL